MKYITVIILSCIILSCKNENKKNNKKETTLTINKVDKKDMHPISLGTSEELTLLIKEIHNYGGIDSLISWSKDNLIEYENFQLEPDLTNKKPKIFIYKGLRIYKLDKNGNELNQIIYESTKINSNNTGVCYSFRENFKGDGNYNFVIY